MDGEQEQNQKASEQQQAAANAARVRDLRSQIAYWQQQYAADPVANANASDVIAGLTNELNGIPNSGTSGS